MDQATARHLVVVSRFEPRPERDLKRLLASLHRRSAGRPFDLLVVVNRLGTDPLPPIDSPLKVNVLERENTGMNIGAWNAAYQRYPDYDGYLFLQDECRAHRRGWLDGFVNAAAHPESGLIGESYNQGWARPWEVMRKSQEKVQLREHLIDAEPANRVDVYLDFMGKHQIDPGAHAGHLRSLVWYLPGKVLRQLNGFPIGDNYGQCIAAEIAVSRQIEALGLTVKQVAPDSFHWFSHQEWYRPWFSRRWRHRPINTESA